MSEPLHVEIAGNRLRCKHCGGEVFYQESAFIDRPVLGGLFHREGWLAHQATFYVCSQCGFLHWFFALASSHHEPTEDPGVAENVECLSCGRLIPSGASACPSCGWSWRSEAADSAQP
jgi:predicted RNA-binding Zn-ribbon protein involved in translation (DUF1610 family)